MEQFVDFNALCCLQGRLQLKSKHYYVFSLSVYANDRIPHVSYV